MGSKTGESRSICEWIEKDWTMTLPNPLPLSSTGSYFQLRQATLGYHLNGTKPTLPLDTIPLYIPPVSNAIHGKHSKHSKAKNSALHCTTGITPMESTVDFKVILNDLTVDIEANTKIGLVGRNGCGKSTLLKIIDEYDNSGSSSSSSSDTTTTSTSSSSPSVGRGSIFKANHLRVAYYQQHQQDSLPYETTPLNYLTELSTKGSNPALGYVEQTIRSHLASFGIGGELINRPIGTLSGGQKSRLVLAELTFTKPHVLLLDEPTNNLDLDAVTALTNALKAFNGAYIIASHDITFIQDTCEVHYHIVKGAFNRLENGVDEYVQYVKNNVKNTKNKKIEK